MLQEFDDDRFIGKRKGSKMALIPAKKLRMTAVQREIQDAYTVLNNELLLIDLLVHRRSISGEEYWARMRAVIAGRRVLQHREYDLLRTERPDLFDTVKVSLEKDCTCWQKEGF